jgi:hypothetical protein
MADGHDQRTAVREDLDPLIRDLRVVSGSLEEVATAWRRMGQFRPGFPGQLQETAEQVVRTVCALADAAAGQPADLAASALAQLSSLKREILAAETVTGGIPGTSDSGLWGGIEDALGRADKRLSSLVSRLRMSDSPVPGRPDTGAAS